MVALAVAMLAPACAPPAASADSAAVGSAVQARAQIGFYDVEGSTAEELAVSLRDRAPRLESGPVYGAHAWDVRWSFRHVRDRGECRLRDVQVELVAITTLPRWEAGSEVPAELVEQWNAFTAALFEHERGHQANGTAAAQEVRNALASLRRLRCETITREANEEARRIVERYREADLQYDRRTEHGRTQGAVWPPEP